MKKLVCYEFLTCIRHESKVCITSVFIDMTLEWSDRTMDEGPRLQEQMQARGLQVMLYFTRPINAKISV